jgi:hypothetical protein
LTRKILKKIKNINEPRNFEVKTTNSLLYKELAKNGKKYRFRNSLWYKELQFELGIAVIGQILPAKSEACFVNRSKRFVLEPPKGGYGC